MNLSNELKSVNQNINYLDHIKKYFEYESDNTEIFNNLDFNFTLENSSNRYHVNDITIQPHLNLYSYLYELIKYYENNINNDTEINDRLTNIKYVLEKVINNSFAINDTDLIFNFIPDITNFNGTFIEAVYTYNNTLYSTIYIVKKNCIDTNCSYQVKQNINDSNFNERYDVTPKQQQNYSVRIPVLMYHMINKIPKGKSNFITGMYVTPSIFEEQIAYITKMNYKTLTPLEFYTILKTGKNPKQKFILLTFDDGKVDGYTQAYTILKKYKQTGTFYIPTHRSGITATQLKEMSKNKMIIDSHSQTHPDLTKLNNKLLKTEIGGSKYELEKITGKTVYSLAYPGCVWNSDTINTMSKYGYLLGFSCGKSIDHYFKNRYVLSRIHVFNDMKSFKKILSGITY